jgi:hypothetical protein
MLRVDRKLLRLLARIARTVRLGRQARWLMLQTYQDRSRGMYPGTVRSGLSPEAVRAAQQEGRRQAALPRVPSPGGWTAPRDVLPAWNWAPPSGMTPRLDRSPRWVRLWYRVPFADRYAHAWMWRHGGWDVVPPEAWPSG